MVSTISYAGTDKTTKGLIGRYKVPELLKHHTKEIEVVKARVRVFWLFRYLYLNLCVPCSDQVNLLLRNNPLTNAKKHPFESWEEG